MGNATSFLELLASLLLFDFCLWLVRSGRVFQASVREWRRGDLLVETRFGDRECWRRGAVLRQREEGLLLANWHLTILSTACSLANAFWLTIVVT